MECIRGFARLKHTRRSIDVRVFRKTSRSEWNLWQRSRIATTKHVSMHCTAVKHGRGLACHISQVTTAIEVIINGTAHQG